MTALQLVVFDLDGTLVDSLPDLVLTVNAAMAELGFAPVDASLVGPWVGRGSRALLACALRHHGVDHEAPGFDFESAFARFLLHYARNLTGASKLYPGVRETLAQLCERGMPLAVCTNKPERFVAPLLEAFGIERHFRALLGGDSLPERKPSPVPLLHLMRLFDAQPSCSLMVGDSCHDVLAARGAGMRAVGLRYGYAAPGELERHAPDAMLDSIAALPALIDRWTSP